MNIYAFDVDDTLWLSNGPVQLQQLVYLKQNGHVLGLCGNWAAVTQLLTGWGFLFSFIGPMEMGKAGFLNQIKTFIRAEHYIMVGNDGDGETVSADRQAAEIAGWEFVPERDFKEGL
jgi:hypothetical protein